MTVLVDINHEAGDFSEYTSTTVDAGTLAANGTAALAGTSYGMACTFDGATNNISGRFDLGTSNTSGIVRTRFYFDPNSASLNASSYIRIFSIHASSGVMLFNLRFYDSTRLRVNWIRDGGTGIGAYYTITDAPHYIEIEVTRASSAVAFDAQIRLWVDGTLVQTNSGIDNYDSWTNVDYFDLGIMNVSSSLTVGGTIYLDELIVNDDGTEIGAVAAGGAALTVADSSHSHTADSPTLAQAHSLTLADSSHSQAADSPSLAQTHTLTVADTAQAHTSGSPTLTQDHGSLTIAEASQAQAADSPTLTQAHTLTIADSTHAHAADGPTLAVDAPDLNVASATHAHTADSPSLAQDQGALTVASAAQAHTADSLLVTQDHGSLSIDEDTHAQAADSLVLSQKHTLTPAEASHTHTVASLALAQLHTLAIADALHLHLGGGMGLTRNLEIQGADHGQATDGLAFTQVHYLVIQDAIHGHRVDQLDNGTGRPRRRRGRLTPI